MRTDREILKVAKANHKAALKNKELYERKRDAILMRIVESEIPRWGGLKVTVVKL
jgi:hypothetical protein